MPASSRLLVSDSTRYFKSETVRASSIGNITVVSYGYHTNGGMPSWAKKAFLIESLSWGAVPCGIEILAIIVAAKQLKSGDRRWAGALTALDVLGRPIAELSCLSAPTYGHPYPIPESVVPRTLAIYCKVPEHAASKCLFISENVKVAKFIMNTGDLAGYSASFEPRPVARVSQTQRARDARIEHRRIMAVCVSPLPVMDLEMKAKLHLWVSYHRHMGLSVAIAVESTQSVEGMPAALLHDEEVAVYAPGILSGISFYDHVGGKKRGKYRRHFDSDKTLTTTFIRFESRIARNADISFIVDFDEFLYAPKAPDVSNLFITLKNADWKNRCAELEKNNTLESIGGLKRVVSGLLDEATDARAAVLRPTLNTSVLTAASNKQPRWPPAQLIGLRSQGQYIRDIILNQFACAIDDNGFGIQIDLPRADVANEYFSRNCMSDGIAAGIYSLYPCVEYMDLLQKGSATKRNFKNKVLNVGHPCPGDMIHTSCIRQVKLDRHAYGTSCSCDMFIQDELVVLHHWFRGVSPRAVKQQVCMKARETEDNLITDTIKNYHQNYYDISIRHRISTKNLSNSCQI